MVEKLGAGAGTPIWTGIDGLDYWGRAHHIQAFVTIETSNITPIGGFIYVSIQLLSPGNPNANAEWQPNPSIPFCMLRYKREGVNAVSPDEHFDLVTAFGDGVQPVVVTRLVGVPGPSSAITAGGPRTQRWEIFYQPGQYVSASIDGVEGARVTVANNMPNPAIIPGGASNLAGCGVYLYQGNTGDGVFATFHSMMIETYRP